ncbi:COX15/CtaA family protein [Thalassotalea sp. LPB0316]|uniref:COX15/CtaA family protein n=1 Tax=Thalassotalea sp. LPB0316 TaxID=2769490 RepID=UPI001867C577|nr:COX15/CtaA family protein [Thalassotalea sp. LPB0316]QOL26211.1 COX15/CtaA family protein [Thalassotalea sp. LPB0316]
MKSLRTLVLISIILAIVVVTLGAYTRLTHAGLGCPDWPGCYGQIDVPRTAEQIAKAEQAFPERPVEVQKAWNEMIHRYFAGALGLFVLAIAVLSYRKRHLGTPLFLPMSILALVIFQAALGMWTVTMKLMPIVVMGHLLGGFTTLCLLFLLYLRLSNYRIPEGDFAVKKYAKFAGIGVIILTLQIALGGWTSSNYAALVCTELPICQQPWVENLTFENSFDPIPPKRDTYEYGHLDHYERVTIHAMHRIGAIITAVYLLWLALKIFTRSQSQLVKQTTAILTLVLFVQVGLGVSNIVLSLPLAIAVSHNIIAACLMMVLIKLTYTLKRKI